MVKPIKITPLNTTNMLRYRCESCAAFGTITLKDSIINIDNDGNPIESLDDYECPKCERTLCPGQQKN